MKFSTLFAAALLFSCPLLSAADTYKVDPTHSSVNFYVTHMGVSNAWGRFNDLVGSLSIDEENPAASTIEFTVKTASIDTNSAKRDDHLRSPDYFNAKQFPEITFKSKNVSKADGKENTYLIAGDLNLHGVTRSVIAEFVFMGKGTNAMSQKTIMGGQATLTIDRTDFGMDKHAPDVVGASVTLIVSIEAEKS